jgi:outer membrane protein assembly factor BamB
LPKRKIIVTSSEYSILGLDASNGDLLWNYELEFKGELPCNAPLYDGEYLYWVAGPVNGAVMASLTDDGVIKNIIWKNKEFDTFFGDFVKAGDYLYGSSKRHGKWVSVNSRTGKIKDLLRFYMGATILVDDMLIVYNQKGRMGLIHMNQEKMTLASQFRISKGTGEHFSHPVVSNGILFIRHGDTLLAYDISVD